MKKLAIALLTIIGAIAFIFLFAESKDGSVNFLCFAGSLTTLFFVGKGLKKLGVFD